MNAFITGTDTAVGKTYATARLTQALRRTGFDTIALKPVCCGERDDAEILRAAADDELSLDEVNPFWFRTPVAPLVAARVEQRTVPHAELMMWFERVTSGRRSVLVEGAGGWLVPVAEGFSVAGMAREFGLPVVLVVANKLGCINHTLLTLESIRAHGLPCAGLILNRLHSDAADESVRTNREVLEELAGVPILCEIAPGQERLELALA